jgi:hypothetical protein
MKIGIVSVSLIAEAWNTPLSAQAFLCPDDALEKSIDRLEKALATTKTSLANKKAELKTRKEREDSLIAQGKLTLL